MTDRSIPIQLDRLRHIRFTFNDLADLQAVSPLIFQKDMGDFSVIRNFLWAGLRHENPQLQPYPAGALRLGEIIETWLETDQGTMSDLISKCTEAMNASLTIKSLLKKKGEQETPVEGDPSKNLQETGSLPSNQ